MEDEVGHEQVEIYPMLKRYWRYWWEDYKSILKFLLIISLGLSAILGLAVSVTITCKTGEWWLILMTLFYLSIVLTILKRTR